MGYMEEFNFWLSDAYFDEDTKKELEAIKGDEKEIEDRFYKELEFGTGGLRGVIGAGTNRMNIYTVRKATQGLANYIVKQGGKEKSIGLSLRKDFWKFIIWKKEDIFLNRVICCRMIEKMNITTQRRRLL